MMNHSSGRKQRHTSSQIFACVWERYHHAASEKWNIQVRCFQESNEYAELSGIDGEALELELKYFHWIQID